MNRREFLKAVTTAVIAVSPDLRLAEYQRETIRSREFPPKIISI